MPTAFSSGCRCGKLHSRRSRRRGRGANAQVFRRRPIRQQGSISEGARASRALGSPNSLTRLDSGSRSPAALSAASAICGCSRCPCRWRSASPQKCRLKIPRVCRRARRYRRDREPCRCRSKINHPAPPVGNRPTPPADRGGSFGSAAIRPDEAEQSRYPARGTRCLPASGGWHEAGRPGCPMSENLTAAEARELLADAQRLIAAIDPGTVAGRRNRAVIGLMGYAWASLDAVLGMQVRDYYALGDRRWVRLIENGFERHELVDRRLEQLIDEYLAAAGIAAEPRTPLFRTTLQNGKVAHRKVSRGKILGILRNLS